MKNDSEILQDKAEQAMKKAIINVVKNHKLTGRPLAIWENGKAKLVYPDKLD